MLEVTRLKATNFFFFFTSLFFDGVSSIVVCVFWSFIGFILI